VLRSRQNPATRAGTAIIVSQRAEHLGDSRAPPAAGRRHARRVGIFSGLWRGLTYGVLAPLQCWPFIRARPPCGSIVATLTAIG